MRRLLLALVALGCIGLEVELLLIGHVESWTQWIPLVVLGAALVAAAALWLRPGPRVVLAFRAVMLACVVAGLVGLWLHFAGNRAFELEMEPGQGGWLLAWRSLRGATPALAPGAMMQVGLLGLVLAWRHPAQVETHEPLENR